MLAICYALGMFVADLFKWRVGAKLSEILGQSIVVENRPGASARREYVANQPGDGYTLLASPIGPMSMAAAIFSNLKYDPIKSFVPFTMIGQFPVVVRSDTPMCAEILIRFI